MRKKLYFLPVFLGLLSLALSVPLVVLKVISPESSQRVVTRATFAQTSVSIFPQKATYKLVKEIPMGIIYESNDQKVKNIDAVLTFDPQLVEILTVSPGILMDEYVTLKFDNKLGQVVIFAENDIEKPVNGILAGLKFRPKKEGIINFEFAAQTGAQKKAGAQFVITQ